MSNCCPISKNSHYVKLEGHSLERIQLNADIVYAHLMIVLTSDVFNTHAANTTLKVFKYCFKY